MSPLPREEVGQPDEYVVRKLEHSLQPLCFACLKQSARRDVDITPLSASEGIAGFPMTSLLNGTPFAAIWKRAD